MEINMIQSANYVPGVSGYRLDLKAGAIEINSGHVAVGSLPSDPQIITVTAGEWPESDLPRNAIERYKFIGDQVMKIPAEHRDSAEFSTEDISFDRDGSDIRTTLTYRRLETEQEAAERAARQSGPGVTINADDVTIMANGKVVARLGRCMDDKQPAEQPFAVKDDQVFVSQALVEQFATKAQISEEASARASADEALASRIGALEARLSRPIVGHPHDAMADYRPGTALLAGRYPTAIDRYAVTMARSSNGQYVCTGVGVGVEPAQGETKDGQTDLELAIEKGDVSQALLKLASSIAESNLGLELRSKIDAADPVREVIRKELRPGGLLYRR